MARPILACPRRSMPRRADQSFSLIRRACIDWCFSPIVTGLGAQRRFGCGLGISVLDQRSRRKWLRGELLRGCMRAGQLREDGREHRGGAAAAKRKDEACRHEVGPWFGRQRVRSQAEGDEEVRCRSHGGQPDDLCKRAPHERGYGGQELVVEYERAAERAGAVGCSVGRLVPTRVELVDEKGLGCIEKDEKRMDAEQCTRNAATLRPLTVGLKPSVVSQEDDVAARARTARDGCRVRDGISVEPDPGADRPRWPRC